MQISHKSKISFFRKNIIHVLVILGITLLYLSPIFKNITNISHNNDLTSYLSVSCFQKLSALCFRQFPLWSPYFGGGYPIIGDIEDTSLTPNMFLVLLFGEVVAFKLLCIFLYLTGAFGTYYLARNIFKYSIAGAYFSVSVFVFTPYFYVCIAGGDPKQLHYLLYPILLALFIKSKQDQRFLYFCSVIFTFMLFEADFVALIFLLFIGLYITPTIFKIRTNKPYFDFTYFNNFIKLICVTMLLGAVKFIPLLKILSINSRKISSYALSASQAVPLRDLINTLVGTHNINPFQFSVGFIPIIFTICSILIFGKKLKAFILPLIIVAWISMGHYATIDLWRIFRQLPFFHSQKDLDQYYPIVIVLIISLISGKFVSYIFTNKKLSYISKLFFTLIIIVYAIIRFSFKPFYSDIFSHPIIKENFTQNTFAQAKVFYYADYWPETDYCRNFIGHLEYFLIKNNIGTINWKGMLLLPENAIPKYYIIPNYFFIAHDEKYSKILNPAYKGEAFFTNI